MSKAAQTTEKGHESKALVSINTNLVKRKSSPRPWNASGPSNVANKADGPESVYSRQPPETDYFSNLYGKGLILQPPYNPFNMYLIYERSDVLRWCIASMRLNVSGFGYSLTFVGKDRVEDTDDDETNQRDTLKNTPKESPEALAQREKVDCFFEMVNENGESFKTISLKCREDYEVTGNAAMEAVRNSINEIEALYYVPIKFLRKTVKPKDPISVEVTFIRNGQPITLKRRRYFRTYVQQPTSQANLIYYKEYGDPRVLNAITGEFVKDADGNYVIDVELANKIMAGRNFEVASEIIWFQQEMGGEAYGIPRWVGGMFDVLGRHASKVINYKLTTKGGTPPFLITVNGGTLTTESMKELKYALQTWQTEGTDTWVRGVILESTPESTGLDDKGTAQINVRWMTDGRKDDVLFGNYGKDTETNVRKCFRIAPIYTGGTEDYNRAVAISAMRVTEQQAFQPEREIFDEIVTAKILREGLNVNLYKYKSNGPRIVGDDEFRLGFQAFAQYGAITLNDSIDMANAAFGLDMSKYKEKWGNYPFALLVELTRQNRLADLDAITAPAVTSTDTSQDTTGGSQGGIGIQNARISPNPPIPSTSKTDKLDVILDPEIFDEKDREFYKSLLLVREGIERVKVVHELTDHEIKL